MSKHERPTLEQEHFAGNQEPPFDPASVVPDYRFRKPQKNQGITNVHDLSQPVGPGERRFSKPGSPVELVVLKPEILPPDRG